MVGPAERVKGEDKDEKLGREREREGEAHSCAFGTENKQSSLGFQKIYSIHVSRTNMEYKYYT